MLPRLGANGGSLFALSCRWSLFLHMALVFQFGQPVRAQPLPGLCPGRLVRTSSCGECLPSMSTVLSFVKIGARW